VGLEQLAALVEQLGAFALVGAAFPAGDVVELAPVTNAVLIIFTLCLPSLLLCEHFALDSMDERLRVTVLPGTRAHRVQACSVGRMTISLTAT